VCVVPSSLQLGLGLGLGLGLVSDNANSFFLGNLPASKLGTTHTGAAAGPCGGKGQQETTW